MADYEYEYEDFPQTLAADLWPIGTKVQLLSVPWDENYRDVVAWDAAARDAWFDAHLTDSWHSVQFTHLRPGEPVALPVPYSSVYKYNYLAVTNPSQPVTEEGPVRTQYYFITGSTYLSPQATLINVQLDVMTTYAGEIEIGRAYVEQGHVAIAEWKGVIDSENPAKADILDLPEGLDVGAEYVPVRREYYNALGSSAPTKPVIIIVSSADLSKNPGTTSAPYLNVASGQTVDGLPSGCNVYMVELDTFKSVMAQLQQKSWVAQCIVAIYAFPGSMVERGSAVQLFGGSVTMHYVGGTADYDPDTPHFSIEDVSEKVTPDLGGYDPKLGFYPYSVIELSTMTGNPIYLKPQLIYGNRLDFHLVGCALAPFAKVGLFPVQYGNPNRSDTSEVTYDYVDFAGNVKTGAVPSGDFLDTAVWLTDFPQFSIVNNSYITYMASTTHTRAASYAGAGWSQQAAGLSAKNDYNNAYITSNAAYTQAQQQLDARKENAGLEQQNMASQFAADSFNGIGNIVGDVLTGNIGKAISGAFTGAMTSMNTMAINSNNATMTQNSIAASAANADTQRAASRRTADNNYALAQKVAQGDYSQQIRSIEATVQDAALTPPSVVGQAGGNGFNWKNGLVGFFVTFKRASGAALRSCHAFFMRYGYRVQRFVDVGPVTGMLCCEKFAYWKLLETYLTCGPANETERMAMRGVFEKGVTLWKTPELIGTADPEDNAVIAKQWWPLDSMEGDA